MRTPDTAHLCAEDAELVRALYLERNRGITAAELERVRANAASAVPKALPRRHARHAA